MTVLDFTRAFVTDVETLLDCRHDWVKQQQYRQDTLKQEKENMMTGFEHPDQLYDMAKAQHAERLEQALAAQVDFAKQPIRGAIWPDLAKRLMHHNYPTFNDAPHERPLLTASSGGQLFTVIPTILAGLFSWVRSLLLLLGFRVREPAALFREFDLL